MTDLTSRIDLEALAVRVETLSEANFDDDETRALNEAVLLAVGWRQDGKDIIDPTGRVRMQAPPVLASIDAALQLVPEGCKWGIGNPQDGFSYATMGGVPRATRAATPALALTAAALRARCAS